MLLPQLLWSEVTERTSWFVESAVPGQRVDEVVEGYLRSDDRKGMLKLIERLVAAQGVFQREFSSRSRSEVPRVESRHFEDYLHVTRRNSWSEIAAGYDSVQHGDYVAVNIFVDAEQERCGVIDWERMGEGYPPLFDLLTLFRSLRYAEGQSVGGSPFPQLFLSFVNSFFKESWFSQGLRQQVRSYCAEFGINSDAIFDYFLAWLVIQCNRCRLEEVVQMDVLKMYENMLRYAVTNHERFVLGRGNA